MNDNGSGHTLTVEQFDSASEYELIKILDGMKPNQKKLFLIELSKSVAVRTSELTDENTADRVQQRISKVWRVYRFGGVSDLLLDMSDDKRKEVLKQLGRGYEIYALIHVGIYKRYKNEEERQKDVKRMFSAIEDERRNRLLNDIIYEKNFDNHTFKDLMAALKGSVESNEIADMLLGVEDKNIAINMISMIPALYRDDVYEYFANILLSIDGYNVLRSMIFDLKDKPTLILKILRAADDIGKFTRFFNIIKSSGISNENMEILLANDWFINKMIDKPEDEQNEILERIDTQLVNKIKCAVKEAEKLRKVGIATIAVAVVVVVIETVFTRMSIKDALNNGHAINDEAVISRMMMAVVTVIMMLSVIVYVKWANRPVWYDRLMIGGSLVMALVRVLMGVYEGICEGVNMNECVRVRVRMMAVMIAVMMAIASVVAVINGGNEKNDGVYVSKNAGGIAKSVIVVMSTCVMAMTGWVIQVMGVDVEVSSEMNNEMLLQ